MPRSATRGAQWSWATGEKGRNRVRVYTDPKTGALCLTWYVPVPGRRPRAISQSLGHTNRNDAKAAAEAKAAALRTSGPVQSIPAPQGPLLVGALFDTFEEAMQQVDRLRPVHVRARKRFVAWWGALRSVASLDEFELERYAFARRHGKIVVDGKALPVVRTRPVEEDLTILRTVLRWACRRKTATGARLLAEMPILTWDIPKEENPRRVQLPEDEYQAMRDHAWAVDPAIWLLLVVCHETGHRLNSVRQLRWSDVRLQDRALSWRAECQKNGAAHETPMTDDVVQAFSLVQLLQGGDGDAWVFPGPRSSGPVSRELCYRWWRDVRTAAGLALRPGSGFHCFRRKLASDLSTAPLAMVKSLGGWKHPQIVLDAYQAPNMDQQRAVLDARAKYAAGQ